MEDVKMAARPSRAAPPEWDRILSASQRNDADEIRRLIEEEGVSPAHANAVGQSAVHIASLWGNVEAVRTLLSLGSPADAANNITGATPLHCAVQSTKEPFSRRVECVSLLIDAGADAALIDRYGASPLNYVEESAAEYEILTGGKGGSGGWDRMRDALLTTTSAQDALEHELFELVRNRNVDGVRDFLRERHSTDDGLECGGDSLSTVDQHGKMGFTPLLCAVDAMVNLCDGDKEIKTDTKTNDTAAMMNELADIVGELLEAGAAPNTIPLQRSGVKVSSSNEAAPLSDVELEGAPLHWICAAVASLHTSSPNRLVSIDEVDDRIEPLSRTALFLRTHGATVCGATARLVHDAARRGRLPVVKFLVGALEISPNVEGQQGMTPLHFAARSGRAEVVRWLLSYEPKVDGGERVDVALLDDRGMTALDAARVNERLEVVRLLEGLE